MVDYTDIVGTVCRNNAGNLSDDHTHQIFYDSTNIDFKYQFEATATAWRTSASANTGRFYVGSAGTPSSFLFFAGEKSAAPSIGASGFTESFNGTSFTEVGDLNTPRMFANMSAGSSNTNAIAMGDYRANPAVNLTSVEVWDGSSWTETTDMNTARRLGTGTGTSTASLAFGGFTPPNTAITESWNGSAWTEVGDLNTARYFAAGSGSYTSALSIGGYVAGNPSPTLSQAITESWNGSAWTEVADLNTARYAAGAVGSGASGNTVSLFFGGNPGQVANTESWNGSSWTEIAD